MIEKDLNEIDNQMKMLDLNKIEASQRIEKNSYMSPF